MDAWIQNDVNRNTLQSYGFAKIVCGTAKDVSGRLTPYLPALREETYRLLWQAIKEKKLDKPIAIELDLNLFKRTWNKFCSFCNLPWKFGSERFADFLNYLKEMNVDDETIKTIHNILH
jgi:hypothetical protein